MLAMDDHKLFPCNQCERKYVCKTSLSRHKKIHEQGMTHQCSICDLYFGQKQQLLRHISLRHFGMKKYECNECGEKLSTKTNLLRHILSIHNPHNESKSLQCCHCKVWFSNRNRLTIHTAKNCKGNDMKKLKPVIVGNEKKYKCDICGALCYRYNGLLRHLETHSSESPYKCPSCDLSFRKPSYLRQHLKRIHAIKCKSNVNLVLLKALKDPHCNILVSRGNTISETDFDIVTQRNTNEVEMKNKSEVDVRKINKIGEKDQYVVDVAQENRIKNEEKSVFGVEQIKDNIKVLSMPSIDEIIDAPLSKKNFSNNILSSNQNKKTVGLDGQCNEIVSASKKIEEMYPVNQDNSHPKSSIHKDALISQANAPLIEQIKTLVDNDETQLTNNFGANTISIADDDDDDYIPTYNNDDNILNSEWKMFENDLICEEPFLKFRSSNASKNKITNSSVELNKKHVKITSDKQSLQSEPNKERKQDKQFNNIVLSGDNSVSNNLESLRTIDCDEQILNNASVGINNLSSNENCVSTVGLNKVHVEINTDEQCCLIEQNDTTSDKSRASIVSDKKNLSNFHELLDNIDIHCNDSSLINVSFDINNISFESNKGEINLTNTEEVFMDNVGHSEINVCIQKIIATENIISSSDQAINNIPLEKINIIEHLSDPISIDPSGEFKFSMNAMSDSIAKKFSKDCSVNVQLGNSSDSVEMSLKKAHLLINNTASKTECVNNDATKFTRDITCIKSISKVADNNKCIVNDSEDIGITKTNDACSSNIDIANGSNDAITVIVDDMKSNNCILHNPEVFINHSEIETGFDRSKQIDNLCNNTKVQRSEENLPTDKDIENLLNSFMDSEQSNSEVELASTADTILSSPSSFLETINFNFNTHEDKILASIDPKLLLHSAEENDQMISNNNALTGPSISPTMNIKSIISKNSCKKSSLENYIIINNNNCGTTASKVFKYMSRNYEYKCETCPASFITKSELKQHERKHLKTLKRGVCSICGKRVSDLKTHMKSHDAEKVLLCWICGKMIREVSSQHHKCISKYRYSCPICDITFLSVSAKNSHNSKHHGLVSNGDQLETIISNGAVKNSNATD